METRKQRRTQRDNKRMNERLSYWKGNGNSDKRRKIRMER